MIQYFFLHPNVHGVIMQVLESRLVSNYGFTPNRENTEHEEMNTAMGNPRNGTSGDWLLYGANGYTGRLIAAEAVRRGLRPILAGRGSEAVRQLSAQLGCEYRVFGLSDREALHSALREVRAVLHCAGPFSATARTMAEACIACGTHYMDITGEIPVLEHLYSLHEEAVNASVAMIPGSGYDVVPTDCLALTLKELLPDATRLRLSFGGKFSQSPGTWRATLEAIPRCGAVRKNGVLRTVPHAWRAERIRFDDGVRSTMTIPWGDLSSAWRSTGIPDIEVYGGISRGAIAVVRLVRGFVCQLMKNPGMQKCAKSIVTLLSRGPGEEYRRTAMYHLRGDVWNDNGGAVTRFMLTPEGYTCTVQTSLAILEALLAGRIGPGVWTPARAMGSGFAATLPGTRIFEAEG
jgi:short subunit dehydrogenase-like uncharacterized protein